MTSVCINLMVLTKVVKSSWCANINPHANIYWKNKNCLQQNRANCDNSIHSVVQTGTLSFRAERPPRVCFINLLTHQHVHKTNRNRDRDGRMEKTKRGGKKASVFLCVERGWNDFWFVVPLAADSVPTIAAYEISPQTAAVRRQQTNLRRDSAKTRLLWEVF